MPRRLRLIMTSDGSGGVASHARTLAAALTARGHEVWLAVFGRPAPVDWPKGVEFFTADYELEWMDGAGAHTLPQEITAARRWLAELARVSKPDILHCNQFGYVGSLAGVPSLLAVHSDVVSWWRHVRRRPPPSDAYQIWYRDLARRALAQATVVVTPSRTAAADLRESFGHARDVAVIANGCDRILPAAQSERVVKEPLAVSLGRAWDPAKQIALLDACDAVRRAGWSIVVAGEALHPSTGARVFPPDGVTLLGQLQEREIAALLNRASIYIGTSCYEPFGLAPLEAALSGCALLLNDIPSFREIWGDTAAYFAHDDRNALDAALERLMAAPAAIAELAAQAQRRARGFNATAMAANYEAAYVRCLM